jgi:catechol 2,3-dioxygenase-like lactoylglutathione lyase family enzyme
MKFGHIEILASDPLRSRQFYEDVLGFEVTVIQNERFIWLKKGILEIIIRPGRQQPVASRYEDAPVGFVLYTEDVEMMLSDLVSKGLQVKGTVDSEKCYTFTDLDGNWFQLVNPDDH